jgi:hypothetical protein
MHGWIPVQPELTPGNSLASETPQPTSPVRRHHRIPLHRPYRRTPRRGESRVPQSNSCVLRITFSRSARLFSG